MPRYAALGCPLLFRSSLEFTFHSLDPGGADIGLQWVEEPPDSVVIGTDFNVSYRVITLGSNFFGENYNHQFFNFE